VEWSGGAQLQTKSLNKNVMFRESKDKLINCLLQDWLLWQVLSWESNGKFNTLPWTLSTVCEFFLSNLGVQSLDLGHMRRRRVCQKLQMDGLTRSLSVARHICDSSLVTEALVEARLAICCCC
jgi:hypothetical protein